jgi:hypothetical protein
MYTLGFAASKFLPHPERFSKPPPPSTHQCFVVQADPIQTPVMVGRNSFFVLFLSIVAGSSSIEAVPIPTIRDARAYLSKDFDRQASISAAETDKVDHLPGLPGKLDSNLYSG